jgi:hypothetical protein
MKPTDLSRHYGSLRPEERFKLILAAGARGDEAEQRRLSNAGADITLSVSEHMPYARAFDELATLIYIELLEEAARYLEFLDRADDHDLYKDADEDESDGPEAGGEGDPVEAAPAAPAGAAPAEGPASGGAGREKMSTGERYLRLALAAGYVLRTKATGWQRFCEQLPVPPWAVWSLYPGYERLQHALALAEDVAFVPEGFLRWINDKRPPGEPEVTTILLTVERIAEETAEAFRQRVQWWGGRAEGG